jgi:transmembrane sensor
VHENAPWQRLIAQTSTRIGEQKSLQLSDGTGLVLNSDSAISTDFENSARIIVLHRGEVAITTGDDHKATNRLGYKRPFLVHTPFGKMQALGTRFVVRLDKDGAQVSVQDGAVRLYPSSGITSIMIEKGSSLRMLKNSILPAELHRFAPDYWVAGAISGTNIPLHELLTEIERYRVGRIICDTRIGSLPITGTFHIRDADRALAFLARTQPISLQYLTRFWVRVHPRST